MRIVALHSFLLVALLLGGELRSLLDHLEKSPLLTAKRLEVKGREELLKAARGKNSPKVQLSLEALQLMEEPTISLHLPQGRLTLPMGEERTLRSELSLSYPIFTGYAITHLIEKRELEKIRAELEERDLLRRLSRKVALLYGDLYKVVKGIEALERALEAVEASYRKGQGFYREGLIPLSDLYALEAKRYEIEAQLEERRADRKRIEALLEALTGYRPRSVALEELELPSQIDLLQREDILALRKALQIDGEEVALARSRLLPTIGFRAALRRFGDDLRLQGDGYRSGDESYIGLSLRYTLYDGGERRAQVEAARYRYLARKHFLRDYIKRAEAELEGELAVLKALEARLEAASKRVEAAESYYKLSLGRYENQLISGDELSRSIASLAEARGRRAAVEAEIFKEKVTILLLISLREFQRSLQ
ncbi:MAG: TolC family protein [Epsilonproteobacteria bacterium]|nr:hypothetical protein [Campylobacterota bacterium]NPA56725.1 TolC family protein [Campylobacterota bacterium]